MTRPTIDKASVSVQGTDRTLEHTRGTHARPRPAEDDTLTLSESPPLALSTLVAVGSVLPWRELVLSVPTPAGVWWCFNPSIHFDGDTVLCSARVADYGMPGGAIVSRAMGASTTHIKNHLVLLELDRASLEIVDAHLVRELDNEKRCATSSVGYEDVRIFRADDKLHGIAASLQLATKTGGKCAAVEQVLLTFSDSPSRSDAASPRSLASLASDLIQPGASPASRSCARDIIAAKPIRGGSWSGSAQKNWSPFDGAPRAHFLYSIGAGSVFDEEGPVGASARKRANEPPQIRTPGGVRASIQTIAGSHVTRGYAGLRGGSQLVYIGDAYGDGVPLWLGIAHEMRMVSSRKLYWHVLYAVTTSGILVRKGPAIKIAPKNGIEFAAGLMIDGDRVVISFGVDDSECRLGVTSLRAILATLTPTDRLAEFSDSPATGAPCATSERFGESAINLSVVDLDGDAHLEELTL